jgi:ataxia telangiectasia mutated family protein
MFLISLRYKLLKQPETIPFRLTQNVVDGMGPLGTEGVFTHAAEATLEVLRENSNALQTILSAILFDPLYSWSLSPIKARTLQEEVDEVDAVNWQQNGADDSRVDRNEAASRAIAKVHEKLQGYEDGTSGERQSVEGQIQLLVNSARDRDNLCELFQGWAPWI